MADKRIFVTTRQIARAFVEEQEEPLIPEKEREIIASAFPDYPRSFVTAVGISHIAFEKGVDFFDIEIRG